MRLSHPIGILGQVWCLNVSIPDICPLSYFQQNIMSLTYLNLRIMLFCTLTDYLFVFVALRPMSTAMVIAGRPVHLTTLFPGQA